MWDIKTVQRCSTRKECKNDDVEIHFERFDMDLNDVNMDVAADLSMDEAQKNLAYIVEINYN